MTVAVPMRQTKDVHQHLSWDNEPVFKDLKKNDANKKEKQNRKRILGEILERCTAWFFSQSKCSGAPEPFLFENLKKMYFVLPLVVCPVV